MAKTAILDAGMKNAAAAPSAASTPSAPSTITTATTSRTTLGRRNARNEPPPPLRHTCRKQSMAHIRYAVKAR